MASGITKKRADLRRYQKTNRDKLKELGLQRVEVWVTPPHKDKIKEYAKALNDHAGIKI